MYRIFYELFQSLNQEQRMEFLKQLYTNGFHQIFSIEKALSSFVLEEKGADFIL